MIDGEFDAVAFVEAAAALLALDLTPESRAGAAMNLEIAADHARNLLAAQIADGAEPAPVFAP
jgi:hypothetical protein